MPPTRSNTIASSPNPSASPEPQPSKDLPERSRNAKAQARHREKRKAYISHLEQSVASLKQQLASMGISGAVPPHALASTGSTSSQAETDARLRELVEENERLKSEIQRLRSKVESMGGGSSFSGTTSSRSSTGGGHHGLTPPATPGVLGGLGTTGGLLPAAADEAFDGRRGSVLGGPVESFLEGNSGQNASHERAPANASTLFSSSSSSSTSQVPLSLHIPSSTSPPSSSAQPPSGLGISGLGARPLSVGSHLAQHQHRYSLPSPLPSALSSSSTPLLPPPTSSYTPASSTPSSSSSHYNPPFRVQSPFGTPVDHSSGWQIPRGSAPSILSPGFLDYPPRGRELPLPAGFGLAPLASMAGGAPPPPPVATHGGYDYLMVSAVRGSASAGPNSGLGEFPSAVPPLPSSTGNVLPPFYGGNDGRAPSSTLPPFSAANSTSSYSYYGLPPNHQAVQQQQQQPSSGSAPPSRANSQSRNGTTGSSSSSSPKSLSPGSPVVGANVPLPFGDAGSFKMQLESGPGGHEFGNGQGFEFGLSAPNAEQGQQWA